MEELKWSRIPQKPSRRGADGDRSVLGRGLHSDKCTSSKCVFLLARVDCNGGDDCGVRGGFKLF